MRGVLKSSSRSVPAVLSSRVWVRVRAPSFWSNICLHVCSINLLIVSTVVVTPAYAMRWAAQEYGECGGLTAW